MFTILFYAQAGIVSILILREAKENRMSTPQDERKPESLQEAMDRLSQKPPVDRRTAIRRVYGNLKGLRDNLKDIKKAANWFDRTPSCLIYAFADAKRIEENLKIILRDEPKE